MNPTRLDAAEGDCGASSIDRGPIERRLDTVRVHLAGRSVATIHRDCGGFGPQSAVLVARLGSPFARQPAGEVDEGLARLLTVRPPSSTARDARRALEIRLPSSTVETIALSSPAEVTHRVEPVVDPAHVPSATRASHAAAVGDPGRIDLRLVALVDEDVECAPVDAEVPNDLLRLAPHVLWHGRRGPYDRGGVHVF